MDGQNQICWVCFPQRDGMEPLQGELAAARRRFLLDPRHAVTVDRRQNIKGFSGHVRGKLGRRHFYWKKRVKGTSGGEAILEEAFGRRDGWVLVVRDMYGIIVSRNFFDKKHAWLRTEYYEPWDSSQARISFAPGEDGAILRRDWDPEKKEYRDTHLCTVPYRTGTAEQSVVDAQLGTPQLLLVTTEGELCCCPKAKAQARQDAMKDVNSGAVVLMPAWEIKGGELVSDGGGEANITFTSLEEYAKIEPAEPGQPRPALTGEILPAPEHPLPPTGEEFAPEQEEPAAAPPLAEHHEAKHMREPVNLEELIDGPAEPEAPAEEDPAPTGDDVPAEDDISLEAILAEATVAAQAPALPGPSQETAEGMAIPSGYTGDIRDGKITGRGRTEQRGGLTSYEGDYVDGKRHGFGTYYYRDGNLCYAGAWKDDRRDGLGVSFRDSDHALHVASWKDGQPQGLVTLFDKQGSLRYSGRMENGKKEGAGVVINGQDGTVFVGQWAGGEATGLGSAFDRDGRLLYYGNWKDGKRHGHGTEFDLNGGVVFDGEFKDGKYFNGVLYQKL